MKKLIVALILVLVLTVTLAAPVFAGEPPQNKPGPGNMPDGAEDALWDVCFGTPWYAVHHMRVAWWGQIQGNTLQGAYHAHGPVTATYQLRAVLLGILPPWPPIW